MQPRRVVRRAARIYSNLTVRPADVRQGAGEDDRERTRTCVSERPQRATPPDAVD
ncbi:MAG TPA: hypothetical protein VFI15_12280 [Candidatus Limnocylindrales bacterium]|nr:hypothetical protein [Candidatus Limnocylindrales bacterium]